VYGTGGNLPAGGSLAVILGLMSFGLGWTWVNDMTCIFLCPSALFPSKLIV